MSAKKRVPKNAPYAWFDGEVVPWADAKLHVHTQCVMRGLNAFEGLRAYWSDAKHELFVFKLQDHLARLDRSTKILRIAMPYSAEHLADSCLELLRRCEFREDVHIRMVVYVGESIDNFGIGADGTEVGAYIFALPRTNPVAVTRGITVCVSSWRRIDDNDMPARVKAGANYLNSRYAQAQAQSDGYDSAVLLNGDGKVSELPGSCLMLIRGRSLITPRVTDGILESITRSVVMELAASDLGLTVEERAVDRTELYVADEVFTCGTGEEVIPIVSVDRYPVGSGAVGPLARELQRVYFAAVRGEDKRFESELLPVYASNHADAAV